MKTSDLLVNISAALAVCISCVREAETGSTDGLTMTLSVSVESGHSVRGSSSDDEDTVNDLQTALFKDGVLYASASSRGSTSDLTVSPGTYDLYAFVNDPVDWASREGLTTDMIMNSASSYSDNTLSSFVMFGRATSIVVDEQHTSATVFVDRFMSRIAFENITVDFSSNPLYKGCGLTIRNIYLTNIIGTCPYSMVPSSDPSHAEVWYNKMKPEDCPPSITDMTADKGLDITIPDGSSNSISRVYYAYPNGCVEDSDSDTWQARRSRVVIEGILDGKTCWYHITLPPMKPNVSYVISNCTIKNIGGRTPEDNSWPACETVITESLNWDHTFTVEEES